MQRVFAAVSVMVVLGMTKNNGGCLGTILQDSDQDTQRILEVRGSSEHSQDSSPRDSFHEDTSRRTQSGGNMQRKLEMVGSSNLIQHPSGHPLQDSLDIPLSPNTNQTKDPGPLQVLSPFTSLQDSSEPPSNTNASFPNYRKHPNVLQVLSARQSSSSSFPPNLQDSLEPPEIPLSTNASYTKRPKVIEVLNATHPNASLPSPHLQHPSSFKSQRRKGFNNIHPIRTHAPQQVKENGNTSSFTSFIEPEKSVSESKSNTSSSHFKGSSSSELKSGDGEEGGEGGGEEGKSSKPNLRSPSSSPSSSSSSSSSSSLYIPSNTSSLRERIAAKDHLSLPPNRRSTSKTPSSNDLPFPNWERVKGNVVTTQGNYSRIYRLPSHESSLSLLGVRSSGEVRIALLDDKSDEAPLNITLYSSPDGDSEIQFNNSFDSHVVVSRHKLRLSPDTYTWLVIFRKDTVVYVYLADKYDPFLVYDHLESKGDQLQLLQYSRFQVWSRGKAYWDLVGTHYKNENKYTNLQEKGLKEELDGIKEGLAERFALMINLVGFLQRPQVVNNMSLPDIQQMSDLGATVEPLRNLLYFFGFLDDKNMHWTSV